MKLAILFSVVAPAAASRSVAAPEQQWQALSLKTNDVNPEVSIP
jgi:hypothetical protein